jgi:uncharacterized protein (DUF2164 family)
MTPPKRGEDTKMDMNYGMKDGQRSPSVPESRRMLQRERAVLRNKISDLERELGDVRFDKLKAESTLKVLDDKTGWTLLREGIRKIFKK